MKFYVNCALKDDINITRVKITENYYDKLTSCTQGFPLPIVKISSGSKKCYAQVRRASKTYLMNFNKYITYSGEMKIFEKAKDPNSDTSILFLSEHYRDMLDITINTNVSNEDDLKQNFKELSIEHPKNLLSYITYFMKAVYNHPEMYSFLMYIMGIFGLTLACVSCISNFSLNYVFFVSTLLLIAMLFLPARCIPIKFSLPLSIFLLYPC